MSLEDAIVEIEGDKNQVLLFEVGFDYLETMGIRLVQGRFFERDRESDKDVSIIINESFVDKMEWEEAIGKSMAYNEVNYYVIGVIDDFHYNDFTTRIQPSIMKITDQDDFSYLVVRAKEGSINKTASFLEATWKNAEPDLPYEGFFQEDVFEVFFQSMTGNVQLMLAVSTVALILACMGLFGLVSFNITKRMKEFSIKKVLGASMLTISKSINGSFFWIMVISMIIGAPLAYISMNGLIENVFPYNHPIDSTSFIIAAGSMLFTALLTVSSQIYKVSKANPAETLRNE